MKKLFLVLLITFLFVASGLAVCYKEAPYPHYNVEKGYGYRTDVPCANPNYKNTIIKTWQYGNSRELFVDNGQDGTCNAVYIFKCIDEECVFVSQHNCEFIEKQISEFLRIEEKRE